MTQIEIPNHAGQMVTVSANVAGRTPGEVQAVFAALSVDLLQARRDVAVPLDGVRVDAGVRGAAVSGQSALLVGLSVPACAG